MKKQQHLEENELMIVNPGSWGSEEMLSLDQVLFGDDGYIYQLQELEEDHTGQELSEVYLGEDGTLYSLPEPGPLGKHETRDRESFASYFLGDDGALYEVI